MSNEIAAGIPRESRQAFVRQVAATIKREHAGARDESFVFGVSGKWGEGKTTFLRALKTELDPDFEVLWLNPWKFGTDRQAFMRSLVRQLDEQQGFKGRMSDWWSRLKAEPSRLERLGFDTSRQRVNLPGLALVLLAILMAWIFYKSLPEGLGEVIRASRTLVVAIALPLVLAALGGVFVGQTVSRAVATLDGLDSVLGSLLSTRKKHARPLVVFVDDLDRVSAAMAREVLDSLRTFFDRPDLAFVVAGDHTVLERALGSELLTRGSTAEQLDEGRRFLKKIFNVYWRLPQPVDQEFRSFLAETLSLRQTSLAAIVNEPQLEELAGYLHRYFDRNMRAAARFVDAFVFTMEAVLVQRRDAEQSQALTEQLDDLCDNPLLVARVLMFQEHCTPFFEAILEHPKDLYELEVAVDRQESEPINAWIDKRRSEPSPEMTAKQARFLRLFLFESPRFYEDSVLTVGALEPFLYLAADAGFEDYRGIASDDFGQLVAMGNPGEIARVLLASGFNRVSGAATQLSAQLGAGIEDAEYAKLVRTVTRALSTVPPAHPAHVEFARVVGTEQTRDVYQRLSVDQRVEALGDWSGWLDSAPKGPDTAALDALFVYPGLEGIGALSSEEPFGAWSSGVVSRWLLSAYSEDSARAWPQMERLAPIVGQEALRRALAPETTSLIQGVVAEGLTDDERDSTVATLRLCIASANSEISREVFEAIANHRDDIWSWAASREGDGELWARTDLDRAISGAFSTAPDSSALVSEIRFAVGKPSDGGASVWAALVAERLFKRLKNEAREARDPGDKAETIRTLSRASWLWRRLERPDRSGLSGMRTYRGDPGVLAAVREVLASWRS
jgi:hypothetical protein